MDCGVFLDGSFHQQQQRQQQKKVMACFPPLLMVSSSPPPSIADLVERQRREMDQYLCEQSNRLNAALRHRWKQNLASLMLTLESRASSVLRQKDEELAMATSRVLELEVSLKRTEEERDRWQRAAAEGEAMALSLQDTLDRVASPCLSSAGGEDEEAASSSGEGTDGWRCRVCGRGDSCAVILPCKHVCSCEPCAALLEACPVCRSVKQGCVEVFLA